MTERATSRSTMRRLVLLTPRSELGRFEGLPDLSAIEWFRVIHQLRFDRRSITGICEVKFQSPASTPDRMAGHAGLEKVETLTKHEDGSYLAYFEGRPTVGWARLATSLGVHLIPPFELTPKNWKLSVIGTVSQLRRFLGELRRLRIHYRVQSIGEADLGSRSVLGILTARQRDVLVAAHRIGYYDLPRRGDSAQVARVLHLGKSTTVEHLRKAEKRLIDRVLAEHVQA